METVHRIPQQVWDTARKAESQRVDKLCQSVHRSPIQTRFETQVEVQHNYQIRSKCKSGRKRSNRRPSETQRRLCLDSDTPRNPTSDALIIKEESNSVANTNIRESVAKRKLADRHSRQGDYPHRTI